MIWHNYRIIISVSSISSFPEFTMINGTNKVMMYGYYPRSPTMSSISTLVSAADGPADSLLLSVAANCQLVSHLLFKGQGAGITETLLSEA